ncbi:MAG TPA: PAS domain S-box protein [Gaiellaceae bacterium]|nr:PAS domain S-box protein [Gaiellaceae bacterium]
MSRLTLALALALLALESALAIWIVATSGQTGTDSFGLGIPAGVVFVLSGLVALARRPENMTGVYLAAAGYLWLLAALGDSGEPWIYTLGFALGGLVWVPFGALVLGYPSGRLETRLERSIPIAAGVLLTATALLRLLVDRTPAPDRCEACPDSAIAIIDAPGLAVAARVVGAVGSVLLIALVIGLFVRRWRGASPALRRVLAPVLGAATLTLAAAALFVVADQISDQAGEDLLLVFYIVFTTVPLAFLFGVLRMRLARSSVAEVVMALERGTPLRDALARALGDPSLEVAYRLDPDRGLVGGDGWVDPLGHTVSEPAPSRGRAIRFIHRRGDRIAALAFDASLTNEPELVDAVTAAAGLALANERLQAELRAEVRLTGALADTAPALVANVDTQGRLLKLNPATVRASGYEHEDELRGKLFWDVFIDDWERDEMKARFAAAAPDFPPAEYENTFTNVRGERLVIYWRASPVVDEAGRVVSIVAGGLDITERKRREEEIRSSEERLRAVIESAPVAIVEIDLEDRVLQWNPAATRIFGWSAEEVVGRPLPIIPPERAHEFRNLLRGTHTERSVTGFETARLRRDGTLVDVEISNAPIRNATGEIVGVMAVFSDVTERRLRAQEAVRQRDFLHAITETVPSFLVAVDADAVVAEHLNNRSFLEAFGWAEHELVGKSFLGLIAREDDEGARMTIASAAKGIAQPEQESIWYDRAGNERIVAWTARPVLDPSGRHLVLVSGTDVTVRRRHEEEIRASRTRLVEAEDEARRKLERNLHDGAQQRLVALSVALRLAESKLELDPPRAASLLAGARAELGHALEELRELARGIHPAVLTARGLGAALESLVSRMPIPVELEHPDERLAPAVEAAAYYVVAESLTNVAKYAQASEAAVHVSRRDGRVVVTVTDDGIGGANPESGSGLRGLADRVAALDGVLAVESPPGAGTRVRAEIPVPTEDR